MKFFGTYWRRIKITGTLGILSFLSVSFANDYFEISKNLDIFATLYKEINTYYVDEINSSKLMRTGIDAMLNSLDPYTNYISEAEIEDYRIETSGQYVGIGAAIGQKGEYILITDVYEDYPAQKNDLRAGDLVLEIDGKSVKGKTPDEMGKLLKGQPKTKVLLKIKREEEGEIVKEVIREEIHVKNVPFFGMINETTGYIKLTGFTANAGKEVKNALEELKKNLKLESVILDLRGNPGGLLHEAVNIVNVFTPKGQLVVNTHGKVSEWDKTYHTLNAPVDADIPLVVMTNKNSASASEIVAGSIQDLDRGVIVGQKSFGKGLVQSTRPLSFNTQLKVTTAKYYIPSGRCIQLLDYSHRNADGSVGFFADSLKKEFKTKGGRKVYDGGGVSPDMAVDPRIVSPVAQSLITKFILFDYASKYRSTHASIPAVKNFSLTDTDFQDFLNFIKGKEYDYTTKTEQSLEEFRKKAQDEKYFDAIKDSYDKLKLKLQQDKEADIVKNKTEIIELLEEEIARRYYYQRARVEATFDDDPDIKQAILLLGNMNLYRKILSGK